MSNDNNTKIMNQASQKESQNNSAEQFSDSDDDMFMNLAPTGHKNVFRHYNRQEDMHVLAKMKRLIGISLATNTSNGQIKSSQTTQKSKQIKKSKLKIFNPSTESDYSDEISKRINEERDRSRDKLNGKKFGQSIKQTSQLKKGKSIDDAAILSIQKQVIKQNDKLSANKNNEKIKSESSEINKTIKMTKLDRFAQIEKQLMIPIQELPIVCKTIQEGREEKREKKRHDRLIQKKQKQYKVGKVRDQTSNCVFNGIEDYFM